MSLGVIAVWDFNIDSESQRFNKFSHGDICHVLSTNARTLHADSPPSPSPLSTLTDLIVYTRKKNSPFTQRSVAVLAGEQAETKDDCCDGG